ncbi:unnamed protein product [Ilex paraguariensis]|uniref:Uncharacterized protein n=1 Tax=Ilex paraguariensis TaxID=185542 RepID=A0ABC8SN26_9AQUA
MLRVNKMNTTVKEVTPKGAAIMVVSCSVPNDVNARDQPAEISMYIPTATRVECSLGMALDKSEGTRSNVVEPDNLTELVLENEMLRTMVETNRNFVQWALNHKGLVILEMAMGAELVQDF